MVLVYMDAMGAVLKTEWFEGDWEAKILSIPDLAGKFKRELILEIEQALSDRYNEGYDDGRATCDDEWDW